MGVRKVSLHLNDKGDFHYGLFRMRGSGEQFSWGLSSGVVSVGSSFLSILTDMDNS